MGLWVLLEAVFGQNVLSIVGNLLLSGGAHLFHCPTSPINRQRDAFRIIDTGIRLCGKVTALTSISH